MLAFLLSCTNAAAQTSVQTTSPLARGDGAPNQTCLPTGVCLDPAGQSHGVGNMPLAMALAPDGDSLVLSLNGWRQQGLQIVDLRYGAVVQTISQPGAFLGLAFSNDGRTLYASGGNEDVI
ncbi:MAG TPA: hypothetical protein VGW58_10025, partial [Pyrinomonadaceae bacterium]|nr:hypothetical protein [Pyrinomonadaceae bacterium]